MSKKIWTGVIVSVASTLAVAGITAGIAKLSSFANEVKEGLTSSESTSIESSFDGNLDVDCEHVRVVVQGKEATCTEDGLTEGRKCVLCGKVLEAQQIIPAFGHEWLETETFVEATCTTDGTALCKCDTCGATDTVAIPALGHVERVTAEAVAPTCTTEGTTEQISCWRCEDILQAVETVACIPHVDENGDFFCDVCRFFDTTDAVEVGDASVGDNVIGTVFRIYRPESLGDPTRNGFQFELSVTVGYTSTDGEVITEDAILEINCGVWSQINPSDSQLYISCELDSDNLIYSFDSLYSTLNNSLTYSVGQVTKEYVDVCIMSIESFSLTGVYNESVEVKLDATLECNIESEVFVSGITEGIIVKRLVFSETTE